MLWELFIHADQHLYQWLLLLGLWTYVIIFLVIFSETGLVVAVFLPGDALLFTAGALAGQGNTPLRLGWLLIGFGIAAVLGNVVNYFIGYWVGPHVFRRETGGLLSKHKIEAAHRFYERYGWQAVLVSRFMPVLRTVAPFAAGIGKMNFYRFSVFNTIACLTWVFVYTFGGYWFGRIPGVKDNLPYVVLGVIVVSLLPSGMEWLRRRWVNRKK